MCSHFLRVMTHRPKGYFIVFEGIDGSGKTYQLHRTAQYLHQRGFTDIHLTEEPTDNPIGKLIREQYLSNNTHADAHTLAYLFAADRMDHIVHPIYGMKKLKAEGKTILCSRYVFSSLAYQSATLPMEWIYQLNTPMLELLPPDLVIFFHIDPHIALSRLQQRATQREVFEDRTFIEQLHERYERAIALYASRYPLAIIDAARSVDEVHQQIVKILEELLFHEKTKELK